MSVISACWSALAEILKIAKIFLCVAYLAKNEYIFIFVFYSQG